MREFQLDFQKLRKDYESTGLSKDEMLADPIKQFLVWYDLALEHAPGKWFEVNAMTLATSDLTGNVSSRIVLLKDIRDEGFVFYSNYLSEKGKQLTENPKASLTFHWPYLGRQVRITGTVIQTTREDSIAYFHSRPRGSQIGAATSAQSTEIGSRALLESQRQKTIEQIGEGEIPCPEHWGGFLVQPRKIEFWQGRSDRLHDRIVYRFGSQWRTHRLSP